MGRKKSKHEDIQLLVGADKIVEPQKVANTFAKYFSSVGSVLENNLGSSDQCPLSLVDRNANLFAVFLTH